MKIIEIYTVNNFSEISTEIKRYIFKNKELQTINTDNGYLTTEQIFFCIKTIENFLINFDIYDDNESEILAPKSIIKKVLLLKQIYKTIKEMI